MKLEWISCYYCYYYFYYYYYYYYYSYHCCCCCCSLSCDHPFQVYYKVRQAVITKCDKYYYKVRLNKQPNEWLPPTTLLSNCVQPRQFFFSSIWTDFRIASGYLANFLRRMTWNLIWSSPSFSNKVDSERYLSYPPADNSIINTSTR